VKVVAKKSLGQNFLVDRNVLEKISSLADIEEKAVLEIGPGTGNLTSYILKKKPKKFFVIEKDNYLANLLQEQFTNELEIINEDILNFDEKNLCNDKLIVFGNLPYNISTEILCKWIVNLEDNNFWFTHLVLMFQKEVADRIISKFNTSNYGRLSILANWKLDIQKIFDVKPQSFLPKPKVDSTLIVLKPKTNYFKIQNPQNLEKITRIFFSHRRKMIKKPFNKIFNGNTEIAKKLNIDLSLRPQNLDFETYYKIVNEYECLRG
jgi:16S rRNA (adenine1518-N6/adenine1519-N6)-dimethyltransferase